MKGILILIGCCATIFVYGQKAERKHIREGNDFYGDEKYTEAEIEYRKSLDANARSAVGTFNLGNALYKQKKNEDAIKQYEGISAVEKNKDNLSSAFHNMGNAYMQEQNLQKGIESYKQALRLNPKDNDTRYNLAMAQKMLQDQQQQQQEQQDQEQDKDQEQKQEEQQKQDQKDQQQKEQQDQKDQQKEQQQEQQQQEQQQNQQQMSKENAEQLLQAIQQDERDTQEKVKEQQMKMQQGRKREKDW